ncbi:MAG: hypothetical protein NTW86_32345, partial [Candidatus Sumerlaeota bacterium]|nr:hypothetical protein [Candidatus Sumerlaeota bacterium]
EPVKEGQSLLVKQLTTVRVPRIFEKAFEKALKPGEEGYLRDKTAPRSMGEGQPIFYGDLYEEGVTVPLIIKAPGVTQPGGVCKRPVEFIDTFPTLFDLCGIPQPPGVEAISMKGLLRKPDMVWKKGAITMTGSPENATIRTDRYRYWEYNASRGSSKYKVALFDHQTDPGEFYNVAEDPKCTDVVAELHGLLHGGWKACLPPD